MRVAGTELVVDAHPAPWFGPRSRHVVGEVCPESGRRRTSVGGGPVGEQIITVVCRDTSGSVLVSIGQHHGVEVGAQC